MITRPQLALGICVKKLKNIADLTGNKKLKGWRKHYVLSESKKDDEPFD